MEFVTELYQQLERELNEIDLQTNDIIERSKSSFEACEKAIAKLKEHMATYTFDNMAEEIYFFKELKPKFYSKLIYHVRLFELESQKPVGITKSQKKYFNRHLSEIMRYNQDHQNICKYYRSGAVYMDELYFRRTKLNLLIGFDLSYFNCNESFCSCHDHTVATLLANEKIADYLNSELLKLKNHQRVVAPIGIEDTGISWAESKASFIELMYGLQTLGVFYNTKTKTKADMSQVARFFEMALGVDLGNYYRTFQEIRIRKKGRTIFIDKLREHLIQRMDQADENPRYN
ncbi:RteC domain-containing protein [Mucilaginibacter boryungensis]